MKKSKLTIVLTAVLCLNTLNFLHAENFLKNPSFENRDPRNPAQPKWWYHLCTLKGGQPLIYGKEKAFDGKYAIGFKTTQAPAADQLVIWRHPALGTALNVLPEGTDMEAPTLAWKCTA